MLPFLLNHAEGVYIINSEGIVYHQHEVLYIIRRKAAYHQGEALHIINSEGIVYHQGEALYIINTKCCISSSRRDTRFA